MGKGLSVGGEWEYVQGRGVHPGVCGECESELWCV